MKKLLSMIMAVSLLIGSFVFVPAAKVNAADYTNGGCVAWAKDRASSVLGISLPATGNQPSGVYGASNWWDVLPNYGYSRGSTPQKNSLAIWRYTSGSYYNYGHVAYVESVSGNTVVTSEGGCPGYTYDGNTGVIKRTSDASSMEGVGGCTGFLGYVYLETAPATTKPYYSSVTVEWTDTWNAGLRGRIETPNREHCTKVGVKIWDPQNKLVVDHSEDANLSYSYVNQTLNIVEEACPNGLASGTTYTFQMWGVLNGETVYSEKSTFTTQHKVYTITYDANGGKVSKTSDTTSDEKIRDYPTPTKEGYNFDGWYTDKNAGTRVSSTYKYNADITIYAHWTKIESSTSKHKDETSKKIENKNHNSGSNSEKNSENNDIVSVTPISNDDIEEEIEAISTMVRETATISGVKKKLTMKRGSWKYLMPYTNSTERIKYKSSNKKVATVSKLGIIKARKRGNVTITVYVEGNDGFTAAEKKVKVKVK